jgi:hypothetical protein
VGRGERLADTWTFTVILPHVVKIDLGGHVGKSKRVPAWVSSKGVSWRSSDGTETA